MEVRYVLLFGQEVWTDALTWMCIWFGFWLVVVVWLFLAGRHR